MNTQWEVVIGLEIHAQLATKTKIFSGAATAYGAEPNTQACVISLGMPGVLPVLNEDAVRKAVIFGMAIEAEIAPYSVFARKNYFYPDLPKGYQISQFELPIVGKGRLYIEIDGKPPIPIGITRAHLEEDAGKSLHENFHGSTGIDLNRAGTPLLEIVSEPDMRSAKEAVAYVRKIHELVHNLRICDGNMQEGSFRCDANVSIRPQGQAEFGTRAEIKNINSFNFIEKAINYEVERQIELIENGGKVVQETRLYDSDKDETRSMRSKEEANDYRYFPDPDLLPVFISDELKADIKRNMPELPDSKRKRYGEDYCLSLDQVEYFLSEPSFAEFFEDTHEEFKQRFDIEKAKKNFIRDDEKNLIANHIQNEVTQISAKLVANWVMGELLRRLNKEGLSVEQSKISPERLAGLGLEIAYGSISDKIGKQVFELLWNGSESADEIIETQGLRQITDTGAIEAIIDTILAANEKQAEQYRGGNEKMFGFFVGQVMKAMQGKGNPAEINKILKAKLA